MSKFRFRLGDKHSIGEKVPTKYKTDSYALISFFLLFLGILFERIFKSNCDRNSIIPVISTTSFWVVSMLLVGYIFIKKIVKVKEVDLFLIFTMFFISFMTYSRVL